MSEVEYTVAPIEVFYKGIKFRSRLESRWGAFFDLLNWGWEYEPQDFNGWFPDFVLLGSGSNRVYVEVKPIAEPCVELQDRIDRSGCPDECLILGLCPTLPGGWMDCRLGWLRDKEERVIDGVSHTDFTWGEALLFSPQWGDETIDFLHSDRSYRGRMTGTHNGGTPLDIDKAVVAHLWGRAHEMVRYDPS